MELKKLFSILVLLSSNSVFAMNAEQIVEVINNNHQQVQSFTVNQAASQGHLQWSSLKGPVTGRNLHVIPLGSNPEQFIFFNADFIYKTMDGGGHWEPIQKPSNAGIKDLIAVDAQRLLLSTLGTIYLSEDQGKTWVPTHQSTGSWFGGFVAANPETIFLKSAAGYSHSNLFRSVDGGNNFSPASLGIDFDFWVFNIAAKDNLAVAMIQGIYLSKDAGKFWIQPKEWKNFSAFGGIAISSKQDIFLAADYNVYKTNPVDYKLEKMTSDLDLQSIKLAIDNDDILYLSGEKNKEHQLYRSEDAGKTWVFLEAFPNLISFKPLNNGKIIINTSQNITLYNPEDNSQKILPLNFSSAIVNEVIALDKDHLFAVDYGLFSSNDAGATWKLLENGYSFNLTTFKGSLLSLKTAYLKQSWDKGNTWEKVALPEKECTDITNQQDTLILNCKSQGQYLTTDLLLWQPLNNQPKDKSYLHQQTIYSTDGKSLRVSRNAGKTWETLLDNLHEYNPKIDGFGDNLVLIAFPGAGVIKTEDGGKTWDLMNTGLQDFNFIYLKVLSPDNYILATTQGVYLSRDGGKIWMLETDNLSDAGLKSLHLQDDILLAGTNGTGVYQASLHAAFSK